MPQLSPFPPPQLCPVRETGATLLSCPSPCPPRGNHSMSCGQQTLLLGDLVRVLVGGEGGWGWSRVLGLPVLSPTAPGSWVRVGEPVLLVYTSKSYPGWGCYRLMTPHQPLCATPWVLGTCPSSAAPAPCPEQLRGSWDGWGRGQQGQHLAGPHTQAEPLVSGLKAPYGALIYGADPHRARSWPSPRRRCCGFLGSFATLFISPPCSRLGGRAGTPTPTPTPPVPPLMEQMPPPSRCSRMA